VLLSLPVKCAIRDIKVKSIVRIEDVFASENIHGFADLTEAVDIYAEWIDAADAAQKDEAPVRRPVASSSRARAPPSAGSDDD
jgi:hypothetical protein